MDMHRKLTFFWSTYMYTYVLGYMCYNAITTRKGAAVFYV